MHAISLLLSPRVEDKQLVADLACIPRFLPEVTIGAHEFDANYYEYKSVCGEIYQHFTWALNTRASLCSLRFTPLFFIYSKMNCIFPWLCWCCVRQQRGPCLQHDEELVSFEISTWEMKAAKMPYAEYSPSHQSCRKTFGSDLSSLLTGDWFCLPGTRNWGLVMCSRGLWAGI